MTFTIESENLTRKLLPVYVCLLLVSGLTQANESLAVELSFPQAFEQLMVKNDALAASRSNLEKTEFLQQAARDLYLPSLDISAAYTRLNEAVALSPSTLLESMPSGNELQGLLASVGSGLGIPADQVDTAFTSRITDEDVISSSLIAVWPVYTGGRITAAQEITSAQALEARFLLALEQQSQFEKLAKVYFGVVLAQQVLQTREDAEKDLEKHLNHAVKLEEQGQIARVERLKAEASHDTATVETQKAKRDLEITQAALRRMLKLDQTPQPDDKLFTNARLPAMDTFIQATLTSYPGLGVLDAKEAQASGLITAEKGKYYPEVFLFGNYRLYEEDTLAGELEPDWLVGVGLKVALLDRSGRSGKFKAARSTLMQVSQLRSQAVQDLSLLVEKTWRGAHMAQEEYTGLQSSLALAKENVRLREKAFAQGLSTSLEVVDAELFLTSVKNRRSVASYNYVVSLAQLLALSNNITAFADYQAMSENEINDE